MDRGSAQAEELFATGLAFSGSGKNNVMLISLLLPLGLVLILFVMAKLEEVVLAPVELPAKTITTPEALV